MGSNKQLLIKISAIISIISSIGMLLSGITLLTDVGYFGQALTGPGVADSNLNIGKGYIIGMGVAFILLSVSALVGGILLLKSLPFAGKTQKRRNMYITGCVFTIIGGLGLSLATIFLYVSFAFASSNIEQSSQPQNDAMSNSGYNSEDKLKHQLDALRSMRERGEITDEEFKKLMLELIKKS